jgi:hypothetical protein
MDDQMVSPWVGAMALAVMLAALAPWRGCSYL